MHCMIASSSGGKCRRWAAASLLDIKMQGGAPAPCLFTHLVGRHQGMCWHRGP